MRNDLAFNVYFVKLIEQHEELYNYNLDTYCNRRCQEIAWKKIANEVNFTVPECKNRWRMLRVCLVRQLKDQKKPNRKIKKPYYLTDVMKFVIPFSKSRDYTESTYVDQHDSLQSNETHSEIEEVDDNQSITSSNEDIKYNISLENQSYIQLPSTSQANLPMKPSQSITKPISHIPKEKKKQITTIIPAVQPTILPPVQRLNEISKKNNSAYDEEDSDFLFLKSLLPDMKNLNDSQKRRFKQRIFQIYDDILNEDQQRASEISDTSSTLFISTSGNNNESNT